MMKQLGADGFRPHEGDPSSLRKYWQFENESEYESFRPHEGDPSSLRRKSLHRVLQFKVSVPTKGTHLLYTHLEIIGRLQSRFRPHEGDPSSLLENGK